MYQKSSSMTNIWAPFNLALQECSQACLSCNLRKMEKWLTSKLETNHQEIQGVQLNMLDEQAGAWIKLQVCKGIHIVPTSGKQRSLAGHIVKIHRYKIIWAKPEKQAGAQSVRTASSQLALYSFFHGWAAWHLLGPSWELLVTCTCQVWCERQTSGIILSYTQPCLDCDQIQLNTPWFVIRSKSRIRPLHSKNHAVIYTFQHG